MEQKRAVRICIDALRYGMTNAAGMHNISKQRVSAIFYEHLSTIMPGFEIYYDGCKARPFQALQEIFNSPPTLDPVTFLEHIDRKYGLEHS